MQSDESTRKRIKLKLSTYSVEKTFENDKRSLKFLVIKNVCEKCSQSKRDKYKR